MHFLLFVEIGFVMLNPDPTPELGSGSSLNCLFSKCVANTREALLGEKKGGTQWNKDNNILLSQLSPCLPMRSLCSGVASDVLR